MEHGGRPVTEGEEIGAHKSTYSPLSSDSHHKLGQAHSVKLAQELVRLFGVHAVEAVQDSDKRAIYDTEVLNVVQDNERFFTHGKLRSERGLSKAVLNAQNQSHDVPPAQLSSGAPVTRWSSSPAWGTKKRATLATTRVAR